MRRDDAPADDGLASYNKSGDEKKSCERWFESPVPPRDCDTSAAEE
jgi:hypothetical protein